MDALYSLKTSWRSLCKNCFENDRLTQTHNIRRNEVEMLLFGAIYILCQQILQQVGKVRRMGTIIAMTMFSRINFKVCEKHIEKHIRDGMDVTFLLSFPNFTKLKSTRSSWKWQTEIFMGYTFVIVALIEIKFYGEFWFIFCVFWSIILEWPQKTISQNILPVDSTHSSILHQLPHWNTPATTWMT